jgi:membrane-bound lytic murein transglycosylase B
MQYNPAFKYALAVGLLADAIAAEPPPPAPPGAETAAR